MTFKTSLLAATALIGLSGCHHNTMQGDANSAQVRLRDAIRAAFSGTLGSNSSFAIAVPRFSGFHPGDVFVNPSITSLQANLPIDKRICNLGEELGPNVAVESRWVGGVTFDRSFKWNLNLKADLFNLFSVTIGGDEPVYAARVRIDSMEAFSLSSQVRGSMYPDGGKCQQAVERALRRGQKLYMIESVFQGAPFISTATLVDFNVTSPQLLNVANVQAGTKTQSRVVWGQETGGPAVLLAAKFRRIGSFAAIRD